MDYRQQLEDMIRQIVMEVIEDSHMTVYNIEELENMTKSEDFVDHKTAWEGDNITSQWKQFQNYLEEQRVPTITKSKADVALEKAWSDKSLAEYDEDSIFDNFGIHYGDDEEEYEEGTKDRNVSMITYVLIALALVGIIQIISWLTQLFQAVII